MSNFRISLVQTALHWEDKKANLEMLDKKIGALADKTELIVLPEMFSTGFSMNTDALAETMDGPTIEWMRRMAINKTVIVTGSVIIKEQHFNETPLYYNRLIWMLPTGEYGFYDKRHLFAYGKEDSHFSSGQKRLIASVNGWKVNLQICYDLRFPVWIRQSGQQEIPAFEYDLLIIVANWPSVRSHAWRTLLQARAIENQCYVVAVNRTGVDGNGHVYSGESMIIGPLGDTIKMLMSEEEIFSYTLDRDKLEEVRLKYPFWRDADKFFIQP